MPCLRSTVSPSNDHDLQTFPKGGRLTSIQSTPAHNRERSTHRTESSKRTRHSQNAHGKLDLEKQDSRPLPTDGAEFDAINVSLEDLPHLSHLAKVLQTVVWDRLQGGQDVSDRRGGLFCCRIHGFAHLVGCYNVLGM